MQSYQWTLHSRPFIATLQSFFYTLEGRRRPIWMCTDESDLVLTDPIGGADLTIKIEHIGYTTHLVYDIGRRDICIRLHDGTRFYRRITGSAELSATQEQLSIDAELGQAIALADVRMISWVELSRQEADSAEIAWRSSELVESLFTMRGLNHDG